MAKSREELARKNQEENINIRQELQEPEIEQVNPIQIILPEPEEGAEEFTDKYYDAILKAYEKEFKRKPEVDENGRYVLAFDKPEQATNFFQKLAEQKVPFLAIAIDANGNPTGQYYMSLGDGTFKEGKVPANQIGSIGKSFEEAMKAKAPTPKSQHNDFKSRLQEQKQSPEAPSDSTAPTPFETTPTPPI